MPRIKISSSHLRSILAAEGLIRTSSGAQTPAEMITYLKDNGILRGDEILRVNGDLTYRIDSARPYRRTGLKMVGEESGWTNESWVFIITPKKAVLTVKSVEEGEEDVSVTDIRDLEIVGAS